MIGSQIWNRKLTVETHVTPGGRADGAGAGAGLGLGVVNCPPCKQSKSTRKFLQAGSKAL